MRLSTYGPDWFVYSRSRHVARADNVQRRDQEWLVFADKISQEGLQLYYYAGVQIMRTQDRKFFTALHTYMRGTYMFRSSLCTLPLLSLSLFCAYAIHARKGGSCKRLKEGTGFIAQSGRPAGFPLRPPFFRSKHQMGRAYSAAATFRLHVCTFVRSCFVPASQIQSGSCTGRTGGRREFRRKGSTR